MPRVGTGVSPVQADRKLESHDAHAIGVALRFIAAITGFVKQCLGEVLRDILSTGGRGAGSAIRQQRRASRTN